jgi:CBS domain-containing protein
MLKVSDLIGNRTDIFSVRDDDTVYNAARFLRECQVRAVGVCNSQGKLVGVISQSDVSDKVAAEMRCPDWVRVSEIMSRDLVTVRPETGMDECIHLMERNNIYHLLVVDDGERFYGMISMQDLLKAMADELKSRAEMLESYIFPVK